MEDAGLIISGYIVTFAAIAAYGWSVLRRARQTARRVPDDIKPWT
jgi:hypothetical protein